MEPNNPNNQNGNNNPVSASIGGTSMDGFMSAPKPAVPVSIAPNAPANNLGSNVEAGQQQFSNPMVMPEKGSKKLKVGLIIMLVLFVLAAGGDGFLFLRYDTAKKDLTTEHAKVTSLTQQINQANTAAASATTTNAATLKKQTDYATALNLAITQLKTKCGSSCNTITVPTAP